MTITGTQLVDAQASGGNRQMINAIIASVLGWSLDLFDLFILLYVAPVIGALFFPSTHATLSLAAVYASFTVTLLMRPIGSAVFGHYADVHGRKGAIMFLILRLVQGVFVGGVVASTHTIGTESVPAKWRGAMSGLVGGGGAGIGALLASFVFLITSSVFPGEAFAQWGWRFMFFSGLLSSLLGWFIFNNLEESPFFNELQQQKAARKPMAAPSPVRVLFSSDYRSVLLINLLITFGGGAGYYLTSGYLPSFLKVINAVPNNVSSLILMGASVAAFISAVLFGALSEIIGRKPTFLIVGVCALVWLPLCYLGLAKATDIKEVTIYALAIAFIGNAGYAPVLVFLNERFPTSLRASGTGLSWNIGFAMGGMMPTFVSLASAGTAQIPTSLAIFSVAIYLIYLIGALIIPETRGNFR